MRLVLHIGMGKTGTSTLQRTFFLERTKLAAAGVLYPTSQRSSFRHHQALMCLVAPMELLSREFASLKAAGLHAVRSAGKQFWDDVVQQIDAERPETVVLSYEALIYLPAQQISDLRTILADVFSEVDVVAYVRHPSSYWLALTQQGVKFTYAVKPPGAYHNRVSRHLARYVEVFDGKVAARAFDPLILKDRCIVRDFLAVHLPEVTFPDAAIDVTNVNESISAEAMCIMQDLHRHDAPDTAPLHPDESSELVRLLALVGTEVEQTTPRLRRGIAEQLVRNHQVELDWLHAQFGMTFPSWTGDGSAAEAMVPSAGSSELRDVLDVEVAQVERTMSALLRRLSSRSLALREVERGKQPLARGLRRGS